MTRDKMQNITIALPEVYIENLKKLQECGMTPSRSEGIRTALREFLKREINVAFLMDYELKER